jgi:hypothetical protein
MYFFALLAFFCGYSHSVQLEFAAPTLSSPFFFFAPFVPFRGYFSQFLGTSAPSFNCQFLSGKTCLL